jgi:hypothetical protein
MDFEDVAAEALEEEGDLEGVGRDRGVVVRLERLADDGGHAFEADGVGVMADGAAAGEEVEEVAPFAGEAAHARVVTRAEGAEEIGAADDDGAVWFGDADHFVEEGLGFVDVFEDVEGADGGEVVVGVGEVAAVVEAGERGDGLGAGEVGFGDFDPVGFDAIGGEAADDLADAAADIEASGVWAFGAEGLGVFGVERGVPVGEELGVGLVVAVVGILVAQAGGGWCRGWCREGRVV